MELDVSFTFKLTDADQTLIMTLKTKEKPSKTYASV